MLVLDLRWLIFALLLVVVTCALLAPELAALYRRLRRGRQVWAGAARTEAMLEQAPFGVLVLARSRCLYANRYARELLRLASPPCRLPATEWSELLKADRLAARRAGDVSGRYRRTPLLAAPADDPLADPQPIRHVRWWVSPQDGDDVVFVLDVSEQRLAENAAATLLNDVSHELRTPLATILTHLEVLSLPSLSPEMGRQSVRLLKAEAKRMSRLVHLMLELGRLDTGTEIERRPVDLLALVEEAVGQVAPQASERSIAITLEADAPLPPCLGDGDRLRQVLLNLLDNAVRYCRPGDHVAVSLSKAEGALRCEVSDDGPGIAPQHLPRVTERFYRAAPQETEGSGLGLALVAEILRRHGSKLEIESSAEGARTGTTVSFTLPAVPAPAGIHRRRERAGVGLNSPT
ncbi:MAG: ATP-binding protein [Dehalococcoidales bacterium]|nr:ATP-binding protein [Dehalococcoidales bacterium]